VAADRLVHSVMETRGYPMGDFDAQADLVSVDHPQVVENYRVAHGIRERVQEQRASTEDLREALLRYRSLFGELLRADDDQTGVTARRGPASTAGQADADGSGRPAAPAATMPPGDRTRSAQRSEVHDERL
jgi:hypothetical protein